MRVLSGRKRNTWLLVFAGLLLLVAGALFLYQSRIKAPSQEQVDKAVKAKDWQLVTSLLGRTDLTTDQGENYFNLGLAHMNLGNVDEAIQALREADDRNHKRAEARFLIASIYAKEGESSRAIHWLRDALDAGFDEMDRIASDPHLSKLPAPTMEGEDESSTTVANLDFLLGTWNTSLGPNAGSGAVTFSAVVPGYMVTETWAGTAPGGASGVFLFDPDSQQWSYSYVDGYGRTFKGTVRTGRNIVITGTLTFMDGVKALRRVEIRSSSGVIDYTIADSRDDGKTWDEEERRRLNVPSDAPRPNF